MPNDQYGYPMPPEPPDMRYAAEPPNAKGFAVASMVIGIVSICFGWSMVILIATVVGLVLAVSSRKMYLMAGLKPNGMATAGLVLNIIALSLYGIAILACVACFSMLPFAYLF